MGCTSQKMRKVKHAQVLLLDCKKKKKRMAMRDTEELSILAGFLDFYSDRATAHGGFVVAATFGIYAVFFEGRNILP